MKKATIAAEADYLEQGPMSARRWSQHCNNLASATAPTWSGKIPMPCTSASAT